MNALLQHRGHALMSAGHSIAVQNFNENLSILTMLALYAIMITLNLDLNVIIVLFGASVAGIMYLIMRKHAANQREHDSLALIGEHKHRALSHFTCRRSDAASTTRVPLCCWEGAGWLRSVPCR